ncbi:RNA-directed DNA polymerase, eukaryota, reverse transcriptase zinc-binding domain protein [Tanacetum coccineum]
MSSSSKQDEVSNLIREEKLHVCVVLETHLKNKQLVKVCDKVFGPWNWFSNMAVSDKGLESSDSKLITFMSFVYAANSDFNVTLNAREQSAGSAHMSSDMVKFNDCVNQIEVDDLCCSGMYFTWTKNLHKVKKGDVTGILKKLDRVMVNDDLITTHPSTRAIFMSCLISDHSPDFLTIVKKGWNIDVAGCSIYSLVKKMKALKDLFNISLIDRECVLLKSYLDVVSDEEKC